MKKKKTRPFADVCKVLKDEILRLEKSKEEQACINDKLDYLSEAIYNLEMYGELCE